MAQHQSGSGPAEPRTTLTHRLRVVASWLAGLVALTGALALAGWIFDIPQLRGASPAIRFNTGALLILTGVTLLILARRVARPLWLAATFSWIITITAWLTLAQYLTGLDFGIDNLLFRHPVENSVYVGRMSVVSAVGLFLLGSALVLLSLTRIRRRLVYLQRLTLTALAVGLLALLGYLYHAHFFTQVDPSFGAISPRTTLALLGAALAILMLTPSGPVSLPFSAPTSAGSAARRLMFIHLPWLLAAMMVLARMQDAGLLSDGVAPALRNLVLLAALLGFGWRSFGKLDRSERGIARALKAAELAREEARAEVAQRTAALTATTLKAEAARARLQAVMESAPDLIAAIDGDYRFVLANQSYVEAIRHDHGASVTPGMRYQEIFEGSQDDCDRGLKAWHRALTGERFRSVDEITQADGSVRIYDRAYGPVIDSSGYVIGAVKVVRDISERRRLEGEAAQNRLLVEQRNRDLETLLHVISHDLKEPLRSIESFSRLLATRHARDLDVKGHDFLDRVVKATGRMGQLLEEIQLLARARQAEPALSQIDGDEVVREVLARLEGTIRESNSTVTVEPLMPSLRVQRVWATQALYNLVANALKFRAAGLPADVQVTPWRQGGLTGFQVLDRGPGVPVEQSDRIFELFQRGVGREVPGTGAGLAIVRQIAERHGGRAWVEPRRGGGSVFTVAFATDGDRAA